MKQNLQFRRIRFRASEQGSSLVEVALVLPVMLLFLTSVAAMVYVLNQYLELSNAVVIGAQMLGDSRGTSSTPCTEAVATIYNAAPYLVEGNLKFTFIFTPLTGSPSSYSSGSACDSAVQASPKTTMTQGGSVTIYATYPCSSPIGVFGAPPAAGSGQLPFPCTLATEETEIIQ